MLEGLIGKKIGMTQVFNAEGRLIPVTVVTAGPCRVVQKKTQERDGYSALQLSFEEVPEKKLKSPQKGFYKKVQAPPAKYLREFNGDANDFEVGTVVSADIFEKGERVDITGVSKGKGFAGGMKRHHFKGGPASHGSMFHRAVGSIGCSAWPSRVWKGQRLPGHLGAKRVTVQGLEVVDVKRDVGVLFIKGAVPGSVGTVLMIRRAKKKS